MTWLIVVIAVVVVLVAAAAYKWSRSASLRRRYGPEYERILALEGGDQRRADAALRERARRRAALAVRELDPVVHARFRERWYAVQGHFVDDPRAAVNEASGLVRLVVRERGYGAEDPTFAGGPDRPGGPGSPDSRAGDELDFVAMDHPEATTRFREALDVERDGGASTEDLRQAFQGYKTLFEAVLVVRSDVEGTVTAGEDPSRPRIRDRVLDLRRRRDDADGDADHVVGVGAGAGAGGITSGGFLARLRRQPADHESR